MPIEVLIKTVFIMLVVVGAFAPVVTWIERKQSAVMQDRIGANRADIGGITLLGLFHPLADVVKLLTKEDFVPVGANRVMHLLAPLIGAIPAIIAYLFFTSRADRRVTELDALGQKLVQLISAESLSDPTDPGRKTSKRKHAA